PRIAASPAIIIVRFMLIFVSFRFSSNRLFPLFSLKRQECRFPERRRGDTPPYQISETMRENRHLLRCIV
ncbi:MAG: hypothetical protein IJI36_09215, partial [Kiritimatiellae bacterium]|nr:hypothetical protein [Kiritimatiellia bacterium]